jgi:hypothetical protein
MTLQERIEQLVQRHGTLRAAIDAAVQPLQDGEPG